MTAIIVQQIFIMFLLTAAGYVLFASGKLSLAGSACLGNILLCLSLPCVIIEGFLIPCTSHRLIGLAVSAGVSAILLFVSLGFSRLFFPKDAMGAFASAFSNAGFFGIPLVTSLMGGDYVFYLTPFIAFLNLLQWSCGVSLLTGNTSHFPWKSLLKAPFLLAAVIGFFFFVTGIPLPQSVQSAVSSIADLNTPLAMFTLGVYLAQTNLRELLRRKSLYWICAVRLLIIPAVSILLLSFLPDPWREPRTALLLASACPVGANAAVYAQLHHGDYPYAVESIILSTLISLFTLPLVMEMSYLFWS